MVHYVVTGKWNSMGAAMEKFINILYLFAEFAHAQNLTTFLPLCTLPPMLHIIYDALGIGRKVGFDGSSSNEGGAGKADRGRR